MEKHYKLKNKKTAVHFRIQTPVVLKWERIYYEEKPQALYEERRGRKKEYEF